MQWNRTSIIGLGIALVAVVLLGVFVWRYTHQDPYKGLVTTMEVQSEPGVKELLEQRIATTQASIATAEANGEEVDLNLYLAIANDALILGDLVTAREAIEKQLDANPLNYVAWNTYGTILEFMTDYEGAEQAYLRAVYSGAVVEEYYRDYIVLLQRYYPERTEDMLSMLERSVDEMGATQWNMVMLARFYHDQGECEMMKAHYDNAVTLSEGSDEVKSEAQDASKTCGVMAQ